jgi:hypothetical protein
MVEANDINTEAAENKPSKFCPECGSEINAKAEICPDCGVRQPDQDEANSGDSDNSERARQFLIAGGVLGFLGILILPIVFCPLAVLCGLLAMFYGRPLAGAGIVAWGVIALGIGIVLGIIGLGLLG